MFKSLQNHNLDTCILMIILFSLWKLISREHFFTNIFQEKTETTLLSYVSNDNAITDIVRQNIFYNNVSKRNKDLFLFKETVY